MTTLTTSKPKGLNISLWIAQFLLAALYLMAGSSKVFQPIDELTIMLPWVAQSPEGLVRFIGIAELLGALGLLLPSLLRIKPVLTPVAALGLALLQLLASGFHLSRGESSVIGMNIVLMAIALFVTWGRLKKAPIEPKN